MPGGTSVSTGSFTLPLLAARSSSQRSASSGTPIAQAQAGSREPRVTSDGRDAAGSWLAADRACLGIDMGDARIADRQDQRSPKNGDATGRGCRISRDSAAGGYPLGMNYRAPRSLVLLLWLTGSVLVGCTTPVRLDGGTGDGGMDAPRFDGGQIDGSLLDGACGTCDDGNPCTRDVCLPDAGCAFMADDTLPYDDGEACTRGDRCSGGHRALGRAHGMRRRDRVHRRRLPRRHVFRHPHGRPVHRGRGRDL
jgi:hypothetical protein